MAPEIASLVGEIILRLALTVLEACVYILAASVRPWRYLLSRSFRTKVNARHAQSHSFLKWWDLFWGFLALLASGSIVATFVVLVSRTSSSRAVDSKEHRPVLQRMERAIVRKLKRNAPPIEGSFQVGRTECWQGAATDANDPWRTSRDRIKHRRSIA